MVSGVILLIVWPGKVFRLLIFSIAFAKEEYIFYYFFTNALITSSYVTHEIHSRDGRSYCFRCKFVSWFVSWYIYYMWDEIHMILMDLLNGKTTFGMYGISLFLKLNDIVIITRLSLFDILTKNSENIPRPWYTAISS